MSDLIKGLRDFLKVREVVKFLISDLFKCMMSKEVNIFLLFEIEVGFFLRSC